MTPLRILETVIAVLTLVGIIFGGYFVLDNLHASKREIVQLKSKELDRDITRNAQARYFYQRLSDERGLSDAEESRLNYLEEQLDRQYSEQAELRQAEDAL